MTNASHCPEICHDNAKHRKPTSAHPIKQVTARAKYIPICPEIVAQMPTCAQTANRTCKILPNFGNSKHCARSSLCVKTLQNNCAKHCKQTTRAQQFQKTRQNLPTGKRSQAACQLATTDCSKHCQRACKVGNDPKQSCCNNKTLLTMPIFSLPGKGPRRGQAPKGAQEGRIQPQRGPIRVIFAGSA